ncbi:MAG: FMN-dependent NADH-azoreductase [Verrucomicrobiales bacterium]|jgi:FMN-dependent NADH-azoreductase|nr:FMN-dependent NADH-azoreductase [Verrucomicrobiales bacterium]
MKTLLHIDSSLRPVSARGSVSRQLTAEFAAAWQARHPDGRVIRRDFATQPLPHLTAAYIHASYKPADQRTREDREASQLADETVAELFAADHVLLGAPMYNFTVPSTIKTWVDHIVQDGTTFRFGPEGPEGLVRGKKVCVINSRGGDYGPGSPFAALDMAGPWLRNALGFLGMTDVTLITVDGVDMNPDLRERRMADASRQIASTLEAW